MQLAGSSCGICRRNVVFDSEATWCARCSTVFHSQCIVRSADVCPTCQRDYDRPENHFVFSEKCPECFRPNDPPQAKCGLCAARTRWDTQAAYDDFLAHMRDTSRVCVLRGIAE